MSGRRRGYLKRIVLSLALAALAGGAFGEEIEQDDPDIPLNVQGATVTAKIGDNPAYLNTIGQITKTGDFDGGVSGSGSVEADVLGAGIGTVKSETTALKHVAGQVDTFGNSSESLKPMIFTSAVLADGATVSTDVDIHFDGLLTVKEEVGGGSESIARVEYLAGIQQFNPATGMRQLLGTNVFDGVARIIDDGNNVTVDIPETYQWIEGAPPADNSWFNNANLEVLKVVAGAAGAGEIAQNDARLSAAQQTQATADLAAARNVYFVEYDETFTFDATVGNTYYMFMDLQTAAGCMGGSGLASYAQSDFSNTIDYTFSGVNLDLVTGLNVSGNEAIGAADYFGGATSATTLSGATLTWGGAHDLNSSIEMATGTTSTLDTAAFTPTLVGALSGRGALLKTGTGTLSLTGDLNSFTGPVALSEGTLDINNGVATTLAGTFSGTGTLLKQGAGTLTLSGNLSSFTGPVALNAGTLSITNTSTLAGAITGGGTLQKLGVGTLTLSGNNNAFAGTTEVLAGTLTVNSPLAQDVLIASGATLGGIGTIGGNVTGAGNVAPGNSIGTITIGGNYTPAAGSVLEIEVNNVATDQLLVGGAANVTPETLRVVPLGRITEDRSYQFMTVTGALTGPFAGFDTSVIGFTARQVGNNYWIDLVRQPYLSIATTRNQQAVAATLDSAFPGRSGDVATVMASLDTLLDAPLRDAYGQIGGDIHSTLPVIGRANTSFLYGMIADRLRSRWGEAGRSGCGPTCQVTPRKALSPSQSNWTAWTAGVGRGGAAASDGNAHGFHHSLGGVTTAIERPIAGRARLGLFYSYGQSYVSTSGGLDNTATIDDHHWGGYLTKSSGDTYMTLAGGFGYDSFETTRRIQFDAIDRTARANYNGWQSSLYAELGRTFRHGHWTVQPFGALSYLYLRQNAMTETGADSLNLSTDGVDLAALRTILGGRVVTIFPPEIGLGCPEISAQIAWTHDLLDHVTGMAETTIGQIGLPASVRGVDVGRDWAVFNTGLGWDAGRHCRLFADYNLAFNAQAAYHTGSGGIEFVW